MFYFKRMATQHESTWKLNPGYVPRSVRGNVMVEVQHTDGTRCISDDFDHRDLWVPEKHGSGAKNIEMYRIL